MDALRQIAYAEHIRSPEWDIPLFHSLFLRSIRRFGRVFEVGVLSLYGLINRRPVRDLVLFAKMLRKGKLVLLPLRNKEIRGTSEMFAKASSLEGKPQ
jgi:hypothetical protein